MLLSFFNLSQDLVQIKEFGDNPGKLNCFVFVPDNLTEPAPVVIALHGCSQNARMMAYQSGWTELAKKHRFIVIYPEQGYMNNGYKCFNWFLSRHIDSLKGESYSIFEMLNYVKTNYLVDEENVYAYGLSAGAMMSVSLAVNYPESFKAVASLAGGPFKAVKNPLVALKVMKRPREKTSEELGQLLPKPNHRLPKLIVGHGNKDNVVNIANSKNLIRQWCYNFNLDEDDYKTQDQFGNYVNVLRHSYGETEDEIVFFEFLGLGHTLPVHPGDEINQGGKTGAYATDFGFFSTLYIAKEFGLVK